jgi:hypothetical protein
VSLPSPEPLLKADEAMKEGKPEQCYKMEPLCFFYEHVIDEIIIN